MRDDRKKKFWMNKYSLCTSEIVIWFNKFVPSVDSK